MPQPGSGRYRNTVQQFRRFLSVHSTGDLKTDIEEFLKAHPSTQSVITLRHNVLWQEFGNGDPVPGGPVSRWCQREFNWGVDATAVTGNTTIPLRDRVIVYLFVNCKKSYADISAMNRDDLTDLIIETPLCDYVTQSSGRPVLDFVPRECKSAFPSLIRCGPLSLRGVQNRCLRALQMHFRQARECSLKKLDPLDED